MKNQQIVKTENGWWTTVKIGTTYVFVEIDKRCMLRIIKENDYIRKGESIFIN